LHTLPAGLHFDISWEGGGKELTAGQLAGIMLRLQEQGCHNINFVTPEHVVPQILEALLLAVEGGLRLPLVYNIGAYDSAGSLRLMDGVVDIYMPDFKFWDPEMAREYLKAPDYPAAARHAIREMHRQVGPLVFDEKGVALRGVLLRHLVMPAGVAGSPEIFSWLAREVSPDTYVNVMVQYHPAGKVGRGDYVQIDRRPSGAEYEQALVAAREAGLRRLDSRSASAIFL
jgi:putative pyruvate formate lyase activating enzyme